MCNPLAIAIVGSGATMIQAKRTAQSAGAFAQAAHDANMQQIKDNRAEVLLETTQKGNMMAEQFAEKQASNRALLSTLGVSSSMSMSAAMSYNKSNFKSELNAVALEQSRKNAQLAYKGQDSRIQLQATKNAAKAARNQAYIKGATAIATAASGLKPNEGQQVGSGSSNYSLRGGSGYTQADRALSESASFKKRFNT
tara:strand:- start:2179 stop:2769 length:591 start_codon:yes stop_codon:yes gene_type:complete